MPNDWALWAHTMATTDQYLGSLDPSAYWDIHDSSGPLGNESPDGSPDVHVNHGHVPLAPSAIRSSTRSTTAPVTRALYSRIFGDLTTGETGPFDPSYSSTLLSDGRLNSSDAPMPALKIVLQQRRRNGRVRELVPERQGQRLQPRLRPDEPRSGWRRAERAVLAARLHQGRNVRDDAHALYAPYYSQYIPATSRNPFGAASGIDGPIYTQYTGQPNNFTGFGWYGQYENWQIANELVDEHRQRHHLSPPRQRVYEKSRVPAEQRLPDSRGHLHG